MRILDLKSVKHVQNSTCSLIESTIQENQGRNLNFTYQEISEILLLNKVPLGTQELQAFPRIKQPGLEHCKDS